MIRIEVWGTVPGAQGSKRHVGGGRMIEQSKKVAPWREAVRKAAIEAKTKGFEPYKGATLVKATYYFEKPKKPKDPDYPTSMRSGDLEKLQRATSDALTKAGVWLDDSQAVDMLIGKRYAEDGVPGAEIEVWPI